MVDIYIHTEPNPERNGLLQALNSRSDKGFKEHLTMIDSKDGSAFFDKYYIGYGHKSIGDCGSITIHIEDVPTHVALAFQHSRLYNGQELSTRYVDRTEAKFTTHSTDLRFVTESWLSLYRDVRLALVESLQKHYPKDDEVSDTVYRNAIHAYAVDIARYFLPIGIHTNFTWHTTLSHADDYTYLLIHHPDIDVSITATEVRNRLIENYPGTFKDRKLSSGLYETVKNLYFDYPTIVDRNIDVSDFNLITCLPSYRIPQSVCNEILTMVNQVPVRTMRLPYDLTDNIVRYTIVSKIDYGILRDLHRHRSVSVRYHFDHTYGFDNRIFDLLDRYLPGKMVDLCMEEVNRLYGVLEKTMTKEWNVYPFGHLFYVHIDGGFIPIRYLMELRSSPSVHFSLRRWIQRLHDRFRSDPNNPFSRAVIDIHPQIDHIGPYLPRGVQTITKK